jgi:hypothetical protein
MFDSDLEFILILPSLKISQQISIPGTDEALSSFGLEQLG